MGNILMIVLGVASIGLGLKGFTKSGLPFSYTKAITGVPAMIIGALCAAFGLVVLLWAGMQVFSQG